MFDGLVTTVHVNFFLVFLEGIFSFFSPCVLPLIPVYMSFLAGNGKTVDEDGNISYQRSKVFFHTLCFVIGISFAFFILGMSFSALGTFFSNYQTWLTRIGGMLIILLGLFQLGVFDFAFMKREKRFHLDLSNKEVNPLLAIVMGFTFSFGWTPCVGPALSSVLILASGAKSALIGNLLILVYTLGFVIPFLVLGLFTTQVLNFLKQNRKLMQYTVKCAGVILVLIGIMTFTGWMNGISSYLNSFGNGFYENSNNGGVVTETEEIKETDDSNSSSSNGSTDTVTETEAEKKQYMDAFDFTLSDQYGNEHTLSDYQGKVVFLNFWATWCGPCKVEMPHIEELYQEYGQNTGDVIFLGVANPKSDEYPRNDDERKEVIMEFLDDGGYTFPVVFDETRAVFSDYRIRAYPTTFMINRDGEIFGYITGTLTKAMMEDIIDQARQSTE